MTLQRQDKPDPGIQYERLSEVRAGWAIRRVGTSSGRGSCETAHRRARFVTALTRSVPWAEWRVPSASVPSHGTPAARLIDTRGEVALWGQASVSEVSCIALPLKRQWAWARWRGGGKRGQHAAPTAYAS